MKSKQSLKKRSARGNQDFRPYWFRVAVSLGPSPVTFTQMVRARYKLMQKVMNQALKKEQIDIFSQLDFSYMNDGNEVGIGVICYRDSKDITTWDEMIEEMKSNGDYE